MLGVDEMSALYTVQASDRREGLAGIARRLYGTETRWLEIYEANREIIGLDPTVLQSGQQLLISRAGDSSLGGPRSYVVQPADSGFPGALGEIALRWYGHRNCWPKIYEANRGVI